MKPLSAVLIFFSLGWAGPGFAQEPAPPPGFNSPASPALPSAEQKIDSRDFPKICEKARDQFLKGPFPRNVANTTLRSTQELKPAPGKKWLLQIAGFKLLLPAGEYERRPLQIDHARHEATAFIRSHNGLTLMIKLRPPEDPEGTAEEKQYSVLFGKKMTFVDFFLEAYAHKTNTLNCKKFSNEEMRNLAAMSTKAVDLLALAMNVRSLQVYKIDTGTTTGILRVADGTKENRSPVHRLVMEEQNGQGILTILATVADERQLNAMAANLAGIGNEDLSGTRPDWFVKLPSEIETEAKTGL